MDDVSLPAPAKERFQPLRAGILNLWQYDHQELRFHDGRLILRGENGAGKSKALELLLPFLLDADLSPQRLDPFGGSSRTMEWNLLQNGRFESRIGYVWLELGRWEGVGEERRETFWTLGCGLRASQRSRRVDSWYFLTRRRMGDGLELLFPNRTPLLKDQLRQQIGGDGWVFDTGREYRERLDTQIFGLGEDRFSMLRHLLLQLRRPHLSERLDPYTLSELLKESLPPLDSDLIGQLSEGFERLDNDQKELARVEAAEKSVSSFLNLYREYVRGVARGRAAEVRQSDSRYHKTAGEVREAEEEHGRLHTRVEELAGDERRTDLEVETTRRRIRGLEQSEAMRSAEALQAKREHAETLSRQAAQDRDDAAQEGRNVEVRRRDLEVAEETARQSARDRDESAQAAASAAREADLEAVHAAAFLALEERTSAGEATVRSAVRQREEGISELRRLAVDRDHARAREGRAEERRREADAQARAAAQRSLEAHGEVERRRELLEEALLGWWQDLSELRLEGTAFEPLRLRVGEIAEGRAGDLTPMVNAAARPQQDALVREQAAVEEEISRVAREKQDTEEERRRVAAVRELGPEPPRTRQANRTGRDGAPLYLLCEFSERLGEDERAGLEAALEAAGLLDAWVLPDGGMLAPDTFDTFLVPAPRTGTTLADLLVPCPGYGVERAAVEAVLRSIAVGEEVSEAVRTDGSFRLGPLRGAWSKPVAEHIGAAAREEARLRRLAELDLRLATLEDRRDELAVQCRSLDERLARLRHEMASLPSPEPLRHAWHQVEAAAGDERRRRMELSTAEEEAGQARAARETAEHRLVTRARELGLEGWLEDLADYRVRLMRFETLFRELARAVAAAAGARARAGQAGRSLAEAVARDAELRQRAQESATTAEGVKAEYEMLEATVGVEAREVLERLKTEARHLEELKARLGALTEKAQATREHRARVQERLALRQSELAEREAERARSVLRLRKIVEIGFLSLAVETVPEEPTPAWSLTRALDLAREIERASAGVELAQEAANRRANRLHEQFRILAADLGADYQLALEQDEDLAVVRVDYNGRDHDVLGLRDALRAGIEARRSLLADHERELLHRFLLGEVGSHLRTRLRQARALVEQMNELLAGCRTASGMALRLAWDPVPEAAPEIREAVRLLSQDLALLSDGDRRQLDAFFQARISEARQQWEAVPWREHLLAALDYRGWYRFRILRRTGEVRDWAELTRHGHDASSGGEKAVALHLPLFAAAAAHYRSARASAPRLILLDEAFAGIDQGMRGRCMGLLVAFDLDFMMTSHDEWGCYEELPGVATYQLHRDPGLEGVAAVRFVWTGRQLREDSSLGAAFG